MKWNESQGQQVDGTSDYFEIRYKDMGAKECTSLILQGVAAQNRACQRMSALELDMSQPSKMVLGRKLMHKSRQCQISRY